MYQITEKFLIDTIYNYHPRRGKVQILVATKEAMRLRFLLKKLKRTKTFTTFFGKSYPHCKVSFSKFYKSPRSGFLVTIEEN